MFMQPRVPVNHLGWTGHAQLGLEDTQMRTENGSSEPTPWSFPTQLLPPQLWEEKAVLGVELAAAGAPAGATWLRRSLLVGWFPLASITALSCQHWHTWLAFHAA